MTHHFQFHILVVLFYSCLSLNFPDGWEEIAIVPYFGNYSFDPVCTNMHYREQRTDVMNTYMTL